HESHEVAVRREVTRHIEAILERGHIGAGLQIELFGMIFVFEPHVSHVALVPVSSRNIPAAPSFFQWTAVIGREGGRLKLRHTVCPGKYRTQQKSRDAQRCGRSVTLEALLAANKLGLRRVALIQRVEHSPLLWIDGGYLHNV